METQGPPVPDQTELSRRGFFKFVMGVLSFLGGLVLGIPLLDSLGGPALRLKKGHYAKVASVAALPIGEPDDLNYQDTKVDAFIQEQTTRNVWGVKHSPTNVTVFSPICPHLGCRYHWHAQTHHFVCPCHGSVFALDGKVLAGPAPRPLDTLPTKIEKGELYVEWERFKVGIPQKVRV